MRTTAGPDFIPRTRLLVRPLLGEGEGLLLGDIRACGRACAEKVCPDVREYWDAAALVTSELVGNALRHGTKEGEPVYVEFPVCPWAFQVRVLDPSPELPQERTAHDADEEGRGLFLVHNYTAEYGGCLDVEPTEDGKTVTCTLPIPASSRATEAAGA
ncbi:ATP-binding protein [Streptomyces chrestomyceticus]|uniref:ATP-binding protein n=1 Tax=Streptomyces chrestomyceticus TaxID=68185 RepID=UPI0019D2FFD2|nr:ATP-binding protein [Streptomyces chrestomyceticus]